MSFTEDDRIWSIPLDRYERDNLVSLLNAVAVGTYPENPFRSANTGDWVMQVLFKLRRRDNQYALDDNDRPNRRPEELVEDARKMVRRGRLA